MSYVLLVDWPQQETIVLDVAQGFTKVGPKVIYN